MIELPWFWSCYNGASSLKGGQWKIGKHAGIPLHRPSSFRESQSPSWQSRVYPMPFCNLRKVHRVFAAGHFQPGVQRDGARDGLFLDPGRPAAPFNIG